MRIDTCICTRTTFKALVEKANANGWTFEQLSEQTGCGRGCGLCRPYVREAIKTGRCVFDHILVESPDDEAA